MKRSCVAFLENFRRLTTSHFLFLHILPCRGMKWRWFWVINSSSTETMPRPKKLFGWFASHTSNRTSLLVLVSSLKKKCTRKYLSTYVSDVMLMTWMSANFSHKLANNKCRVQDVLRLNCDDNFYMKIRVDGQFMMSLSCLDVLISEMKIARVVRHFCNTKN